MVARKGSTGTSMGGQIVRVKRQRFEFNDELCPVCFGVTGGPCTKRSWEGKGPRYRVETHKTTAEKRNLKWPMDEATAKSVNLRVRRK